jgi:predicted amidohydrolase YtcJ
VRVGAPADLCLLDAGWEVVGQDLNASRVRMTIVGGKIVHNARGPSE